MTDPEMRLKDQDRDGIQAEVLYGILGATSRINDDEAAGEMLRIHNEWLADCCMTHPDRFAGLACIPNHDIDAAVGEIERVARRGGVRARNLATRRHDAAVGPLVEPDVGRGRRLRVAGAFPYDRQRYQARFTKLAPKVALAARAAGITSFQMYMSEVLLSVIFSGVLEHHPSIKLVIGEAGTGGIPHGRRVGRPVQGARSEDEPSEYWRRQCYTTYQSDPIGVKLLDELGEDNIMWGSDFPHPDGVWPDSQEYIQRELGHLPAATRKKIVCDNAAKLYRFVN